MRTDAQMYTHSHVRADAQMYTHSHVHDDAQMYTLYQFMSLLCIKQSIHRYARTYIYDIYVLEHGGLIFIYIYIYIYIYTSYIHIYIYTLVHTYETCIYSNPEAFEIIYQLQRFPQSLTP